MSLIVYSVLAALSLGLTIALFFTRNHMLGFPCGIFWALSGAYAYQQYTAVWDLWYLIFFASAGMLIFTIFAAYGLRKSDLSGPDADKGKFIDEGGSRRTAKRETRVQYLDDYGETGPGKDWGDIDDLPMNAMSDPRGRQRGYYRGEEAADRARDRIYDRAEKRKAKASWEEFK